MALIIIGLTLWIFGMKNVVTLEAQNDYGSPKYFAFLTIAFFGLALAVDRTIALVRNLEIMLRVRAAESSKFLVIVSTGNTISGRES